MQAGWFPDPSDAAHLRYWDGAAWTDHTAPAPSPAPSPAPVAPTAPAWGAPTAHHQATYVAPFSAPAGRRKSSAPLILGILAGTAAIIGVLSWLILSSDTYDEIADRVRNEGGAPSRSSDDATNERAQAAACEIEGKTIKTAMEAYRSATGAYPTSFDDMLGTGPNAFLAESPAERWSFTQDTSAYGNGTQGIGRCEGF